MKTTEHSFIDWESNVFGYGYGSGEERIVTALKGFLSVLTENAYDYTRLERALTPTVAWLLINTLCHADIIEYGTSPRFGWLTDKGEALRDFMSDKSVEQLCDLLGTKAEDYISCSPDFCNCGPSSYNKDRKCLNPFW